MSKAIRYLEIHSEMHCSICGLSLQPIDEKGVEWERHNAQPINDGTCCTDCNDNIVTPRRLSDLHNRNHIRVTDITRREK